MNLTPTKGGATEVVLVTGANGFLGQAVLNQLVAHSSFKPIAAFRSKRDSKYDYRLCSDFNRTDEVSALVQNVDCVIHCAARVHMMEDSACDPLQAFRRVNTLGTLELATQASAAGVKRFIFISSIKVMGEETKIGSPYFYSDSMSPQDPYGISKAEAEVKLRELGHKTTMEIVIIRPPLIYGPGVKANFLAMLKLAQKNLPLPLGAVHNKRSLVALDNIVDLIVTCIHRQQAANQTFLVSDDQDVSTTELLQIMTLAAGKKPWLIPMSVSWLRFAGKLTGKKSVIDRLCGSLQVEIQYTKDTLNWKPPITLEEGIAKCFESESVS